MLLGNGVAVLMLLVMPKLGRWMQRTFHLQRSIFLRLVLSTYCLALVNLLMSLAEDEISMLAMGAVQSFLNAMVLNTSHSLVGSMSGNRRAWIQLGFLSGALLPVLTTPFTGFGPKSPLWSRVAFYSVPASFCFIIAVLLQVYHTKMVPHLADIDGSNNMAELAEAYRSFERSMSAPPAVSSPRSGCHFYVAFLAVLSFSKCYQMISYFFAGLFPLLGDATVAFNLYLYMICGDMVGSLLAFVWTSCMGSLEMESIENIMGFTSFISLLLLSLLSSITALIPSLETLQKSDATASLQTVVVSAFLFGSFSKAGLEAICPKVVRARLAGVLLGLSAVLLCYETILKTEAPLKVKHGEVVKLLALVDMSRTW
eukprot:Skav211278  [mRNA]  locus=scaffold2429:90466:91739:+ [translate_table: standard]